MGSRGFFGARAGPGPAAGMDQNEWVIRGLSLVRAVPDSVSRRQTTRLHSTCIVSANNCPKHDFLGVSVLRVFPAAPAALYTTSVDGSTTLAIPSCFTAPLSIWRPHVEFALRFIFTSGLQSAYLWRFEVSNSGASSFTLATTSSSAFDRSEKSESKAKHTIDPKDYLIDLATDLLMFLHQQPRISTAFFVLTDVSGVDKLSRVAFGEKEVLL
ncbi:hypothetical protein NEUTE2DRAFT_135068 [Neurospora tetrasperma FGSC 2509]|nr:hypothetical protein NEUTE2DRAFT_135068 [Neurospora tetrasperma FGSC 2509]